MITFFVAMAFMSFFHLLTIGLGLCLIWLLSFFDAFSCRRKLRAGEHVADDLDGAISFIKKNRGIMLIIITAVGIDAVQSIIRSLLRFNGNWIITLALLIVGLSFLGKKKQQNRNHDNDFRDMR